MKSFISTLNHSRYVYNEFMNRFEQKMLVLSNKLF